MDLKTRYLDDNDQILKEENSKKQAHLKSLLSAEEELRNIFHLNFDCTPRMVRFQSYSVKSDLIVPAANINSSSSYP